VKKVIVFAMLAALAATPVFADKGEFWFGFNGGVSGPTGDFSDAADLGFHGTLTTIYFLTPVLGIGADIGYHWWGASDAFNDGLKDLDEFLGATPPSGAEGNFSSIQATAQATFMIPMEGKTRPYLAGGLGLYSTKVGVEDAEFLDDGESSSDFGFNLGGGLNWMVSPMYQVGIGAAYHSIQGDEEEGGNLDFYTVGINLLWGKGGQ